MKSIFNQYLLTILFCAVLSAQNIGAYLGINPSASITSKADNYSSTLNYTTFYSFDQNNDITKYNRISATFTIAGKKQWDLIELITAYTSGLDENYTHSYGLNYNYKKRKFGFSVNAIQHSITLNGVNTYNPIEIGTSMHFRLRKKEIKPYFHFSHANFKNNIDPKQTLIVGAVSRINNISLGTHIVSFLDKLKEGGENFSYIAVSIGFIFD